MENNPIEKCVSCGVDTQYRFNDHIDHRIGYIEGAGQLCHSCWSGKPNTGAVCIPGKEVKETPNDAELGEKVRKIYWEKLTVNSNSKCEYSGLPSVDSYNENK